MAIVIIILLLALCIYLYYQLKNKQYHVEQENTAIKEQNQRYLEQNKQLIQTISEKQNIVSQFQSTINAQQQTIEQHKQNMELEYSYHQNALEQEYAEVVKSLIQNVETVIENLKNKRQELSVIETEHKNNLVSIEKNHISALDEIDQKIADANNLLASLKAKQQAYIDEQLRREAIVAQKDYYRLALTEIDEEDIKMLRNLQVSFSRKEAIDKLVWEVYYKPAFDAMTSRVIQSTNKICGIYKITSLTSEKAYIGQSLDIRERWRQHIKSSLAYGNKVNKLYQAMSKEGPHNFTFEVLEETKKENLNERETYWIEFYRTKDYGLNSSRGGA